MIHKNVKSWGSISICQDCGRQWDCKLENAPEICTDNIYSGAVNARNQLQRSREPVNISRHNAERIEQVLSALCEGIVTLHDVRLAGQQLTKLRELLK